MLSNIIKHEDYVNPTYSFCEFFGKYLKYLVIKKSYFEVKSSL